MKLSGFLRPYLTRMYSDQPSITTPQAIEAILAVVDQHPEAERYRQELMRRGAAVEWGGFYGLLRSRAQRQVKKAATRRTPMGDVIELALQSKLPLPDPDLSPTLGDCTVIMIRESIRYLRQHRQGVTSQIAFHEAVAAQLDVATIKTSNPALTVREAGDAGLIDWSQLAAA